MAVEKKTVICVDLDTGAWYTVLPVQGYGFSIYRSSASGKWRQVKKLGVHGTKMDAARALVNFCRMGGRHRDWVVVKSLDDRMADPLETIPDLEDMIPVECFVRGAEE